MNYGSKLAVATLALSVSATVLAFDDAWVYEYGSNTPRATKESWTSVNLVDTSAAADATFSARYNNEGNCFDGKTDTRWITNARQGWVIYRFGAATEITSYGVRQATNNGYDSRVPVSWRLYGSNAETPPTTADDASWEKLDERANVFSNFVNGGNYDFKSRVMWLSKAVSYRSYMLEITSNKSDDYTAVGELEFYAEPFPVEVKFKSGPAVSRQDGGFRVSGSFISNADFTLLAIVGDGAGEAVEQVGTYAGSQGEVRNFEHALVTTLAADRTYSVTMAAAIGEETNELARVSLYNGGLILAKTSDAKEESSVPAVLTVSRAAADPVALSVDVVFTEGTAKEGRNYEPAVNPVVIPAGETTSTFNVKPLLDGETDADTVMSVSIAAGNVAEVGSPVSVTIENRSFPADKNVWFPVDGNLASTAVNWSKGHMPTADDDVLLDGDFSKADMIWDGGVNGLGDTVKSWTQTSSYTGLVTVNTTFAAADPSFTNLTVTGDVVIDGGTLSPKTHGTSKNPTYRLMMTVGGNFTVGAGAKVSAAGLGRYIDHGLWGGSSAHGGDNGSYSKDKTTGVEKIVRYNSADPAFGAMLAPESVAHGCSSGTDQDSKKCRGGGAVRLAVAGDFRNDGIVDVDGGKAYAAAAAGGSIYVTARNILGTGTYTSKSLQADKTDGTGAIGSGGRIALVAGNANEATVDRITCYGRLEGWGRRGGAGTVYLKSALGATVSVKGFSADIQTTTPIPAADDTMDWRHCAKEIDLVGLDYAHLRLTKEVIWMKSVSLKTTGNKSDLDLDGKVIVLRKVFIDGVDQKLMPGDYTYARAVANGWTWLKDASYVPAVEDDPDTADVDESAAAVEGTGVLRILGGGFALILR